MNEPRGRFTVKAVSNYADASAPAAERWWKLVESPRPTAEQVGMEISFAEPGPIAPSSPTGPDEYADEMAEKELERLSSPTAECTCAEDWEGPADHARTCPKYDPAYGSSDVTLTLAEAKNLRNVVQGDAFDTALIDSALEKIGEEP